MGNIPVLRHPEGFQRPATSHGLLPFDNDYSSSTRGVDRRSKDRRNKINQSNNSINRSADRSNMMVLQSSLSMLSRPFLEEKKSMSTQGGGWAGCCCREHRFRGHTRSVPYTETHAVVSAKARATSHGLIPPTSYHSSIYRSRAISTHRAKGIPRPQ